MQRNISPISYGASTCIHISQLSRFLTTDNVSSMVVNTIVEVLSSFSPFHYVGEPKDIYRNIKGKQYKFYTTASTDAEEATTSAVEGEISKISTIDSVEAPSTVTTIPFIALAPIIQIFTSSAPISTLPPSVRSRDHPPYPLNKAETIKLHRRHPNIQISTKEEKLALECQVANLRMSLNLAREDASSSRTITDKLMSSLQA
ncbi:hypothetical protein ACFE04_026579 [Oxalis oulophora]